MIYTVTLNPALDYIMYPNNLSVGEINRSARESLYFGGKGINVSFILNELGISSVATGFIAGFTGDALESAVSAFAKTDFVRLKKGLTRINVKLRAENETDINAAGPEVSKADINRLFERLEKVRAGDTVVLSGSVPKNMPADIYENIMKKLSPRRVKFAVDAEGEALLKSLEFSPFLIKPNLEELSGIFKTEVTKQNVKIYAEKLLSLGAQNALVSMGNDGACLYGAGGESLFMPAVSGKTVNTVGAGDSMLAGFLAGYEKTKDFGYALRLGTAAGGATAFSEGLATKVEIQNAKCRVAHCKINRR